MVKSSAHGRRPEDFPPRVSDSDQQYRRVLWQGSSRYIVPIREVIFGRGGLLHDCMDGRERCSAASRVAGRALNQFWRKTQVP